MSYSSKIFIVLIFALFASINANSIPLKEIQSLTLYKGQYTTRIRTQTIPQLKCEGGCYYASPDVVQCYNTGTNGYIVNWKCQALLPNGIEFKDIHISCEGYRYSGDPNVLHGSCGLSYSLVDLNDYTYDMVSYLTFIIFLIFIGSLFICIVNIPSTAYTYPMYSNPSPVVFVDRRPFYSSNRRSSNSHVSTGFGTSSSD